MFRGFHIVWVGQTASAEPVIVLRKTTPNYTYCECREDKVNYTFFLKDVSILSYNAFYCSTELFVYFTFSTTPIK